MAERSSAIYGRKSPLPLRSVLDACHWHAEPLKRETLLFSFGKAPNFFRLVVNLVFPQLWASEHVGGIKNRQQLKIA